MRLERQTVLMLWVAGGAACGGLLRAGLGQWLTMPWATLAANLAGSFLIALIWMLTGPDGRLLVAPGPRFGLMAGLCGGLTTFSLFSAELWTLWLDGARLGAVTYLAASIMLWLLAAWTGMLIGRRLNQPISRPGNPAIPGSAAVSQRKSMQPMGQGVQT